MEVDVDKLENLFANVVSSDDLTETHITALTTKAYLKPNFFSFPAPPSCLEPLRKVKLNLRDKVRGEREKERVANLLEVLGTLENVGILLCFVDPLNYCMFSGYVVTSFFPVASKETLEETYLAFRDDLRTLGDEADIERVADVDRALCALWMERPQWHRDKTVRSLKRQFDKDSHIMRLRLERSGILPLFRKPWLAVADLLLAHDERVAGMFGRLALEELVGNLQDAHGLSADFRKRFMDRCRDLPVLDAYKYELERGWHTGSECVHPGRKPDLQPIRELVELVHRLERRSE